MHSVSATEDCFFYKRPYINVHRAIIVASSPSSFACKFEVAFFGRDRFQETFRVEEKITWIFYPAKNTLKDNTIN